MRIYVCYRNCLFNYGHDTISHDLSSGHGLNVGVCFAPLYIYYTKVRLKFQMWVKVLFILFCVGALCGYITNIIRIFVEISSLNTF